MKKEKTKSVKPYKEYLGFVGGLQELWKHKMLYLMTLPTIIWVLIFCYYPMYGAQIAFRDYSPKKGSWGAPGWTLSILWTFLRASILDG